MRGEMAMMMACELLAKFCNHTGSCPNGLFTCREVFGIGKPGCGVISGEDWYQMFMDKGHKAPQFEALRQKCQEKYECRPGTEEERQESRYQARYEQWVEMVGTLKNMPDITNSPD